MFTLKALFFLTLQQQYFKVREIHLQKPNHKVIIYKRYTKNTVKTLILYRLKLLQ